MCNDNDAIEIRNRNVTIHNIHTHTQTYPNNVKPNTQTRAYGPCN